MRKRIIKVAFSILGIGIGYTFFPLVWELIGIGDDRWLNNWAVNILLGILLISLIGLVLVDPLDKLCGRIEVNFIQQKPEVVLSTIISVVVGLIIAVLVSLLFTHSQLFLLNTIIPIVLVIIFGYVGFVIGKERFLDFRRVFSFKGKNNDKKNEEKEQLLERRAGENFYKYKLIDTNILIDGRIYDLAKSGFLEGVLMVPNFVLNELQYIADSSDHIKRVRGRRGLDILNKLQTENVIPIQMTDQDFEEIKEVDSKLVRLAKELDAVIITNDYNLNKVSQFQNVKVLNLNNLAKSLKPRVIPGEKLQVQVIKNGSARQQGVAYLDDGTMIVVEDGRYYINKVIEVEVTSALQTDAGRMIFAKPTHSRRELKEKFEEHQGKDRSDR
ncbi:PIN/TRAM domain-containing protein [Ligilactobacillus ceti]|uniref:Atpase of the pilt family n=1 Tax=Ligilactobacillus ceti DSM 22408 TaxID=1122146 RepID=A0A0R2KL17_9LACO|nr:PIN domain-containing protein [Ligilactobacillus ceti]KRN88454.1 atpase of the pilt family [Ligilactobacillus ceti DSM 22408]